MGMVLTGHGLTPSQAVLALRYALGRFTQDGAEAVGLAEELDLAVL